MLAANSNLIQPPVISTPALGRTRLIWLLSTAVIAGLAVLYLFNPIEYAFYPSCQFYKLTHLHCPGCGSLRALHQLTHGHVAAAFHSNPLLIVSIPMLAWLGISKLRDRSASALMIQPTAAWTIFAIVMLFGILRNLPFAVFSWMAP
jgi:hypothetical protein